MDEVVAESHQMTCISEGTFAGALTYGKVYDIIIWDKSKRQIKIHGDNNRIRWYPSYCFEIGARKIPRLVRILPSDPLLEPAESNFPVESLIGVDIELSDGQRRWCDFATPAFFSQLGSQATFDAGQLLLFNIDHIIVVSTINQAMIEASLKYIERQGSLLKCTRAIDPSIV